MIFDGVKTDAEVLGNLFAREVLRDEFNDAPLRGRELFYPRGSHREGVDTPPALQQEVGQGRSGERIADGHCMDAVEKVLSGVFF